MLASDKTHLSDHQGDKEAHCIYLSCGNIRKDTRGKASARCWTLIGYIPIGKFIENDFQGILSSRLYHLCLDIVTKRLQDASWKPIEVSDCYGHLRRLRTVLIAFLADRLEQLLISCAAGNASPLSEADSTNFGDSAVRPLRTGVETLLAIDNLKQAVEPLDLKAFKDASLDAGLNGVVDPFWRGWQFADPCEFLTPDALHQFHKFFMDHAVKWAKTILTKKEIDRRLSVLQPRVGFRHFVDGFTRFKQHTGREQRDIERVFIAILAGHKKISGNVMKAFRGLLDFIYIAQYESHSDETLQYLEDALRAFHDNKDAIARLKVRNGPKQKNKFDIPKLETFLHVSRFVRLVGSVEQFSSDATERMHMLSKAVFRASNRKEFATQMCRAIDRQEKAALFRMWLEWKAPGEIVLDDDIGELRNLGGYDPMAGRLRVVSIQKVADKFMPKPVVDRSLGKSAAANSTTTFLLNGRVTRRGRDVYDIAELYCLPDLAQLLLAFFEGRLAPTRLGGNYNVLPCRALNAWDQVRMQLRATHDEDIFLPPLTVQAVPPSPRIPHGRYNFVLVKEGPEAAVKGINGECSRASIAMYR